MTGRAFVRRRGTTSMPNATIYDKRLSWSAVGILLALLSRPDEAGHGYRDLAGRGMGEKAVRTALKELGAAGYRHQVKMRNPSTTGRGGTGRFITLTLTSEDPITEADARKWFLENADRWLNRAAIPAARSHQGQQAKPAGGTVRHEARPGNPQTGTARHLSNESQGEESLRSLHRDIQSDEFPQPTASPPNQRAPEPLEVCEHGEPLGLNASGVIRCPKCRHRAQLAIGASHD